MPAMFCYIKYKTSGLLGDSSWMNSMVWCRNHTVLQPTILQGDNRADCAGSSLSQHKSTAGAAMCNEARVCKGITNSVEKGGNHEQMCLCLLVLCVCVCTCIYSSKPGIHK